MSCRAVPCHAQIIIEIIFDVKFHALDRGIGHVRRHLYILDVMKNKQPTITVQNTLNGLNGLNAERWAVNFILTLIVNVI